jgi:SAM-dependent methyltransferase
VEQILSNPQGRTSDLLLKLAPYLKRGQELTLVDGLPSAPFSKNTSGLHANAYYFGHPIWLEAWFYGVHRYPELRERWQAVAGTWDDKIVVDIGCGPGNLFATLGGRPKVLIGVDVARGSLQWAKKIGYLPLLADAHALPLKSEFADIVALNSAFHHCDDMGRVASEAARLVKPGGILISDHDPRFSAFDLRGLGKVVWNLRMPLYRLINRGGDSREGDEQIWAEQTEIHHRPGHGITAEMLQDALRPLGFVLKFYPHNNRVGAEIIRGERGRVPLRMRIAQRLSGINPKSEAAAMTLLCVAQRIGRFASVH